MSETNEVWLVTGAASGLGEAVVRRARARGALVYALDINEAAGARVAQTTGAQYLHCDVGALDAWDRVLASLDATPNRIFLNAGIQIAPPDAPMSEYRFEAFQLERYRRMMSVNVDGVVFGLLKLLPILEAGAAIVATSSLAGVTPYAVDPLYSMSKHAVTGIVRSMGDTLAERDISISALCPGGVDTGIIPEAQRTENAVFMTPDALAVEVDYLMAPPETGKTWAKVAQDKPVFVIRAPGDKGGRLQRDA